MEGDDILDGGPGNDRLDGGTGNDYLSGGAGRDTYNINDTAMVNNDTIYEANDSTLNFISFSTNTVLSDLTFTISGQNLIIDIGSDTGSIGTITILGQFSGPGAGIDELQFGYNITIGDFDNVSFNLRSIVPPNAPPVAGDDAASGDEDTIITGSVLGNDTDSDGGTLSVLAANITTAAGGTVALLADGTYTYTPAANFFGTDSFEYTVQDGQGGSDTATVTLTVNDVIDAPVNLTLNGIAGANLLEGAAGNDTLNYNADGVWSNRFAAKNVGSIVDIGTGQTKNLSGYNRTFDQFNGGAGLDTLNLTAGNDLIALDDTFSARPADTSGPRISGVEIIKAGAGNDIVDLTSDRYDYGDITIDGEDGNDVIWASAGNDTLYGGIGNDEIYGGFGHDIIDGGDGNDTLRASNGNDIITGGNGNDIVYGGNDSDVISGDAGNDTLYGDAGDDILIGGLGNDTLYGGAGRDTFVFDTLSGKDTVKDFNLTDDKLDIADILQGYDPGDNLNAFVKFVVSGNNTDLRINADGVGNDFVSVASIQGVKITDTVDQLVTNGTLIVL